MFQHKSKSYADFHGMLDLRSSSNGHFGQRVDALRIYLWKYNCYISCVCVCVCVCV